MEQKITEYKAGDEKRILELFQETFGEKRSEEFWKWENQENPRGESILVLLRKGEEVQGHLCLQPALFKVGENSVKAGQRINSMFAPGARRKGHYGEMLERLLEKAGQQEIAFTYSFPNSRALLALTQNRPRAAVLEVPRYVKFLNGWQGAEHFSSNTLLRLGAGLFLEVALMFRSKPPAGEGKVEEVEQCDETFDLLWKQASAEQVVAGVRDRAYLEWRYIRSPREYTVLACRKGEELRGYLVLRCHQKVGHIADLLAVDRAAAAALLNRAEELAREKCSVLSCWYLGGEKIEKALHRHGFKRAKSKARLVVESNTPANQLMKLLSKQENWLLTMGDSDYI